MEAVSEQKRKPFCKNIGAAKIGLMAGVDASAPTVRKSLKAAGFEIPTRKRNTHTKRYSRPCANDQWNIDFVELGVEEGTGKKVESLSIVDDHSRYSLCSIVTTSATTDFVIRVIEELGTIHGFPRIINSDHGTQWYAVNGGKSRFDEWCKDKDIKHRLAPIRTPEENGKVERYHGNLRTEAGFPRQDSLEGYHRRLEGYRHFYNDMRPHYALDLRTPREVYYKTYVEDRGVEKLILDALRQDNIVFQIF